MKFMSRTGWGASPPRQQMSFASPSQRYIIVSHTVNRNLADNTENNYDDYDPEYLAVKALQDYAFAIRE